MVQLSDELLKRIQQKIDSGQYASVEEVVRVAVDTLDDLEHAPAYATGELSRLVEEGERSGREAGWLTLDELKARLAAVQRERFDGRQ